MLTKEENQTVPALSFGIHVYQNLYLVFLNLGMI